ncbi:MAG: hypothetical protein FJX77_15645, partial [Armatimonadetes bacterium]|nr:hypothetical protein [Armatimonadota bacterium]
ALAECAVRGKEALLAGDLESFGAVMNENWEAQKALHPEITTSELNRLAEVARSVGAIGFKANGVGGGGTATLLCRRGKDHRVRAGVRELGMQVLPARVDRRGLRVWRVE